MTPLLGGSRCKISEGGALGLVSWPRHLGGFTSLSRSTHGRAVRRVIQNVGLQRIMRPTKQRGGVAESSRIDKNRVYTVSTHEIFFNKNHPIKASYLRTVPTNL
jgi:hypothetical protein